MRKKRATVKIGWAACCLAISLWSCSGSEKPTTTATAPIPALDTLEGRAEEELIAQLAAELNSGTDQRAQEENALLNFAIDNGLPVQRHPSGFFYHVLQAGDGPRLEWGDYVRANYRGSYLDGSVFDSSYKRGKPIEFYIGNMIPVWNQGLQLLAPGGSMILLCPSELGYGPDGLLSPAGDTIVPADQVLVFEVEVLEKLAE